MKLKKWLSVALSATLLLGLVPATAFATDTKVELTDEKMMDFREVSSDMEGDNWDWDDSEKTLMLFDFHGEVPAGGRERGAAIYLPKNSTLVLEGENSITTSSYSCHGIFTGGEFTVLGDGKLDITVSSGTAYPFFVNNGTITFDSDADINVDSPRYIIHIYQARGTEGLVNVYGDSKVAFPDDLGKDAIYVVKDYQVKESDNWFNYSVEKDEFDKTFLLVEKKVKEEKPEKEEPKEEETTKPETEMDEYTIAIGANAIEKNGAVAYRADSPAYLSKTGYTMLPLRALLVVSDPNVDIQWDAKTRTATVKYDGKTFQIVAEKSNMTIDGKDSPMVTASELSGGRLFVSLRDWMAIMDIPETQVNWNASAKTVTLKN